MRKLATLCAVMTALLYALALPAWGHVTIQPAEAPAGSFSRFVVRVPNERDDAATTRVEVRFPDNVTNASFQPKAGWNRTVTTRTLEEPIEVFGEPVTEVIDTVVWEGGRIEPGEFDEFGFSIRTPDEPAELVFPAVQAYDSGEEVRWVGEAGSDAPAGRVAVSAAEEPATPSEEPATSSTGLATALGALGTVLGALALALALRTR